MPLIRKKITLDEIKALKPTLLWVARHTGWWTHRKEDLQKNKEGKASDPFGGPVDVISNVKDFLQWVKVKALEGSYGRHGITAFIGAHNDNCRVSATDDRPTCMATWKEYNDVIIAQNAAPKREPKPFDVDTSLGIIPDKTVQHEANPRVMGRENSDGPEPGEENDVTE
jgi:hypothetical protein